MAHILLISGSLRAGSTNSALVRTAAAVAPAGISTAVYGGLGELPHFNPDDDGEGAAVAPAVAAMRAEVARADAILFCTPEYAGAMPGSFKNLLEWNVGTVGINGLPAAWVNVAGPGRGENAHESLRKVLGYVDADLVEEACVRIPVSHDSVGEDGLIADPEIRAEIVAELERLAAHVEKRRS